MERARALLAAAYPVPEASGAPGAGRRGSAVEVAPRLLPLGQMGGFVRRPPLSKNRKFSSKQMSFNIFCMQNSEAA